MEHFSGIFSEYYYFFLRDNKNGKKHEIPEIFELNLNTALHRIFLVLYQDYSLLVGSN